VGILHCEADWTLEMLAWTGAWMRAGQVEGQRKARSKQVGVQQRMGGAVLGLRGVVVWR